VGVDIVEEMAPVGGGKAATGNAKVARGQIHESMTVGTGGTSAPTRDEPAGSVEHEDIAVGKRGVGRFSERAQKMLANIDKHGTVNDDPPDDASPPAAGAPAIVAPTPATPAAATPAATAAPAPAEAPDPAAEHRARADRYQEHNTKLVAELEQLRSRPARGEMTAREKALDEAERSILDDSIGAARKIYMTALGVDDPEHPLVDKHLTWLYHDLTERELGVPLDGSVKAQREAERTRHLLDRDKRDRAQEAAKPAAAPSGDPEAAQKVPLVAQFIAAGDHATKYPLLRNLSTDFDGMEPAALLWREINRGFQTGEYQRQGQSDADIIDLASRQIEAKYQALADKIAKARPQTAVSTATPTQAPVATDRNAEPQGTGPRTITNASASVAPATTPAAKPAPTEPTKKPWRNEKERIRMLAAKHFGDG